MGPLEDTPADNSTPALLSCGLLSKIIYGRRTGVLLQVLVRHPSAGIAIHVVYSEDSCMESGPSQLLGPTLAWVVITAYSGP